MRIFIHLLLPAFLILFSCQQQNTEKRGDDLKVGVSVFDMTPPTGYLVHKVKSDGVLDSLEIKTMVFSQSDRTGALVMADLFYIPLELSDLIRREAAEQTGIPVSNICLAATHTHADPTCYGEMEDYISKMGSSLIPNEGNYAYVAQLIQKIVYSIVEAQKNLKPVLLRSGFAQVDGLAFNRRHLMKDGTVRMNGGFLNPDIVRTVGPVDNELGIILFDDKHDKTAFASFTTFAMQLATIGNTTKFSSGFPHFLEQELQKYFGNDFLSVFGEGPCADVNHWDITKPGPQTGYEEVTSSIGRKLATGFLQETPKFERMNEIFKVSSKVVNVPLQTYSDMDLEWVVSHKDSITPAIVQARIKKILSLQKLIKKYGDTLPLEIQVFMFNEETAIVALPGQIFVELGLALKRDSPFKNTLILTLANSHEECIPLRKAFPEGSYEIVYSLIDSGGGEILIEKALSLLNEVKTNKTNSY